MLEDSENLINTKKIRFLLTVLLGCGACIQYTQKIDLSVAIICMVNHTAIDSSPLLKSTSSYDYFLFANESNKTSDCLFQPSNGSAHSDLGDGKFVWSKDVQGFILSSYFYGYILLQIPSGWLASRIGGQKVLLFSMFSASVLTLIMPIAAQWGYFALIVVRFLAGIVHGMVWPAVFALIVPWSHPSEKSRLIGFSSAGSAFGNVIALPVGSILCVHGFAGGWPSIFYVFGLAGLVWSMLFYLLTSETPNSHKFINDAEREYINDGTRVNTESLTQSITTSTPHIPWSQILKSKSCLAIFASHWAINWSNYLFLTQLPSFMNDILRFDIKSNGFFSALPYIASVSIQITSSILSDMIIKNGYLSRKTTRRLFNGSAFTIGTLCTIALLFVTCSSPYVGVVLLVLGIGSFGAASGAGINVSINEVGGRYSGILCGISNCFATMPGIIAPYIVGVITSKKLQSEWQIVFMISAVIYIIGGTSYHLFVETVPFYTKYENEKISVQEINENIRKLQEDD